ncbi:probable ubiquitin-like-specific protease 2B isoform X3 [Pyrus x bretschneideri]|uniref:probable ubiquitin-like-specific protease 2B isoform X3 n=1 Tax=Pyrus x bretschneideri TaxID=225117 RepID=UPI00202DE925|nr:probable ubiquitin-like-specific protease 2B isoform X3 [Pyrus x bretschneideri]
MKTSGLEVFDFSEEDDHSESVQGKYFGKLKNPSLDTNPNFKYDFLQNVAQGAKLESKDISSIPCVDVDSVDQDHCCDNAISYSPVGTIEESLATKIEYMELDAAPQFKCLSHEQHSDSKLDSHGSKSPVSEPERRGSNAMSSSLWKSQLHSALAVSPSSNDPINVILDADESTSDSPSSPASEIEEDDDSLGTYKPYHCSGDLEMDNINMTVVLYPDYVIYRDSYCTEPQLTFSPGCIKISGSTSERPGTFSFEWEVGDLIDVECQWFKKVEFVMIKLRVVSKDAAEDDSAPNTSGTEELKIAIVEPNWFEQQQRIMSLNAKYINSWVLHDSMGMETDEDDSIGQRHHFPNFDEPFEDVVYPKGDSDAVSISKRDVDLLQPDTFINDTIIDFYIKYLKNQIQPEKRHRFHFFNSFFFRKLADLDKDPSSVSDGRAAFQRVRKWTRKVDLFERDYIFIPINFNLHWSLIVICHLGEVPKHNDGESGNSLKVPCILHMDSIKGSHTGLKNLIQSYLWEEWKERKKETSEEISSKFHNLRFVSLELPQQENSFDCGLFLLHYLELFLAEAPVHFSPFKITKFSNFLNANWFLPSEASLKRTLIQRLIFELLEDRCRGVSSAASSDEDQAKFPECNKHETGLVLQELLEPGATPGSLFGEYQSFDQKSSFYRLNGAISLMEDDTKTGEQFAFLPTGDSGFQQITGITSQTCDIEHTSRAYGVETDFNLAQAENGNTDSSPKLSMCVSDQSEYIAVIENHPVGEGLGSSQKEEMDVSHSHSVENVTCLIDVLVSAPSEMQDASVIQLEGSQDHVHDGNENGDSQDHDAFHDGNGSCQDHCKVHDGNKNGGSEDHGKVHDSKNEVSQDHDIVLDANENRGSQDHDRLHHGNKTAGFQDHDKVHDVNVNGASQDHDKVQDGNEIGGSQDHDKVLDGYENGASQDHDEVQDGNENGGFQNHDKVQDGNRNGASEHHSTVQEVAPIPSCQENPDVQMDQDSDMVDNRTVSCDDDVQISDGPTPDDGLMPESLEQRAAKRLRLTPPVEGDKCVTRSLVED